jgi:hypothetical protein
MSMATFANIGLAERRKRHRVGVLGLALGAVVVVAAWTLDLGSWASVASAFLFFLGFLGIFQARARTCVALAAQGVRNMDAGAEAIEDAAELDAARAEARRVMVRSAIATAVVTALALLLP